MNLLAKKFFMTQQQKEIPLHTGGITKFSFSNTPNANLVFDNVNNTVSLQLSAYPRQLSMLITPNGANAIAVSTCEIMLHFKNFAVNKGANGCVVGRPCQDDWSWSGRSGSISLDRTIVYPDFWYKLNGSTKTWYGSTDGVNWTRGTVSSDSDTTFSDVVIGKNKAVGGYDLSDSITLDLNDSYIRSNGILYWRYQ